MAKTSAEARSEARREKVSAERRVTEHSSGGTNYLRIPPGMNQIEITGTNVRRFDVMPYIAGKGNQFAKPGFTYFERTFFTYRGIGANNDQFICPSKTFELPDPVQEHIVELRAKLNTIPRNATGSAGDERKQIIGLLKDLQWKERQLWLINDLDEPQKGTQLWDYSYHLFGKQLDARINAAKSYNDTYKYFADPEEGFTLMVAFLAKSIEGGKDFYEASSIDFVQRQKPYPADIAQKMPCLDDMLVQIPYERLKAIFLQIPYEEDEHEAADSRGVPAPVSTQASAPTATTNHGAAGPLVTAAEKGVEKGSVVKHATHGVGTVLKVAPDGYTVTIEKEADGELVTKVPVGELRVKKSDNTPPAPTAVAQKPVTAAERGLHEGGRCTYAGTPHGVLKIAKDGLTLTLEREADGEVAGRVPAAECSPLADTPAAAPDDFDTEPTPAATPPAKADTAPVAAAAGKDDNWDDWDD